MIKNVYKDEGCTGGYSYLALSEPFVIIPDVQKFVWGLGMTYYFGS